MLSRVANSLYWLSRYIERAENLARIVGARRHASLEYVTHSANPWHAVLHSMGSESVPTGIQGSDISHYITFGESNNDSIQNCIAHARENARMVRDQISEEMWLELNSIHLFFRSGNAQRTWRDDPSALTRRVIQFSLLFQGLADATIQRGEGWQFVQLGKHIERADKTSRILDILTYVEGATQMECAAVLRSCSAFAAFREEFRGHITLPNVTSFLLFSQNFPRSVRFCARGIDRELHDISGTPLGTFSNEPERLSGSLVAKMNFYDLEKVQDEGLHSHIDNLQSEINEIGQQIFEEYVLLPSEIKTVTRSEHIDPISHTQYIADHQQQQQQ